jgi:hypothetical protein
MFAVFGHGEICGPRPRLYSGNDRRGYNSGDLRQALARMLIVLAAVLAKFANQAHGRFRNWDLAVQNVVPIHVISIQCLIPALVSLNDGAVKANSGKNALAARIR